MPWIPVQTTLRECTKLTRLAKLLQCPPVQCIGHLVNLWLWSLEQAPKGALKNFSVDEIASKAWWAGDSSHFVESLITCEWLDRDLRIHNWRKHTGKYLQIKASNAARKRRQRQNESRSRHAAVTRDVPVTSPARHAAVTPIEERRGEKSREEKNTGGKVLPQAAVVEPTRPSATSDPPPDSKPLSVNGAPPTWDEWHTAAVAQGLPESEIQSEWDNQERKEMPWHNISRAKLRHHAGFVLGKWRDRARRVLDSARTTSKRGGEQAFAHENRPAPTMPLVVELSEGGSTSSKSKQA